MDLNGDGKPDVISGSWPGEVYSFIQQRDGTFAAGERLRDDMGRLINVGSASAVHAEDWDGDGDLDLLIGNYDGEVFVVPNNGNRRAYRFGKSQQLQADGKPVYISSGEAAPFLVDWDMDGKKDLLVGTGSGSVVLYRNIGSNQNPKLTSPAAIVDERGSRWGGRVKICVTDWNEDGLMDLLLGDYRAFDLPGLSDEEKAEQAAAQLALLDLLEQYQSVIQDEELTIREREDKVASLTEHLPELRRKARFSRHRYDGTVWVFLRKGSSSNEEQ